MNRQKGQSSDRSKVLTKANQKWCRSDMERGSAHPKIGIKKDHIAPITLNLFPITSTSLAMKNLSLMNQVRERPPGLQDLTHFRSKWSCPSNTSSFAYIQSSPFFTFGVPYWCLQQSHTPWMSNSCSLPDKAEVQLADCLECKIYEVYSVIRSRLMPLYSSQQ